MEAVYRDQKGVGHKTHRYPQNYCSCIINLQLCSSLKLFALPNLLIVGLEYSEVSILFGLQSNLVMVVAWLFAILYLLF